jgi:ribonucleoside-diphosphate reductase alpha chain
LSVCEAIVNEMLMHGSNAQASRLIWRTRYAAPGERAPSDTFARLAHALAAPEADPASWEARFQSVLDDMRFLPAGRILAGAGLSEAPTLCSCFVVDRLKDTPEGVMAGLGEGMTTLLDGGGVGVDFSPLSPAGAPGWRGALAPGPVAFIHLWQAATEAFLAHAGRGGALMASLRCDHPDIEAFLAAKASPGVLSRFNLSVQITEDFLAAIAADADWPLVFSGARHHTLRARALFERIARSAYETGEPGFLFADQIRRENNLWWREEITACNPCGEAPLPPGGACVLGSLNLTRFVRHPFSPEASIDTDALGAVTRTAVRCLDNVLDLTHFPLGAQAQIARTSRRIGLGFTGLGDALVMLGQSYGDERSLETAAAIMRRMRDEAYAASVSLAQEKGAFPAFEARPYLASGFARRLPEDLRAAIARHGIRNSHLLSIAPTGSISLLAGGVSTGIEPIFAPVQTRMLREAGGEIVRCELTDPALHLWRSDDRDAHSLPPGFVSAQGLSLQAHIDMQAAVQPYVDQAISKTWNIPADCPFEDVRSACLAASGRGLKGFAVFRAGSREGVLHAGSVRPCSLYEAPCD